MYQFSFLWKRKLLLSLEPEIYLMPLFLQVPTYCNFAAYKTLILSLARVSSLDLDMGQNAALKHSLLFCPGWFLVVQLSSLDTCITNLHVYSVCLFYQHPIQLFHTLQTPSANKDFDLFFSCRQKNTHFKAWNEICLKIQTTYKGFTSFTDSFGEGLVFCIRLPLVCWKIPLGRKMCMFGFVFGGSRLL